MRNPNGLPLHGVAIRTIATCLISASLLFGVTGAAISAPRPKVAECGCGTVSKSEAMDAVIRAALETGIPPEMALAVARVESAFRSDALSEAGARGLMQIMPATARSEFGVHPDRLWDPDVNALVGARFLARLHDRYGRRWSAALSHYNGGTLPGRDREATPHRRTRAYVEDVLEAFAGFETDEAVQIRIARIEAEIEPLDGGPGRMGHERDFDADRPLDAPGVLDGQDVHWTDRLPRNPHLTPSEQFEARIAALRERARKSLDRE